MDKSAKEHLDNRLKFLARQTEVFSKFLTGGSLASPEKPKKKKVLGPFHSIHYCL